jgi:hypothetical protein
MLTSSELYAVNVSSIQDYMQCRYRWVCKWVLNRVPRNEGPALTAGKLLHQIFEDHFRNGLPLDVSANHWIGEYKQMLETLGEPERTGWKKALQQVIDLREAFPLWVDKYPIERTFEVEEPFAIEIPQYPGVLWKGRPDRVILCEGHIWHYQNRGLAPSVNFGTYIQLAKRHYHEHLYPENFAQKYPGTPIGGTLFNLVRKLKFRTNVGKKKEKTKKAEEMFWQHPMSINLNGYLHRDVMDSMYQHVLDMIVTEDIYGITGKLPPPNEKLNGGFSGNSLDPYFRVLIGEIDLADDHWFKDREDTYVASERDTD